MKSILLLLVVPLIAADAIGKIAKPYRDTMFSVLGNARANIPRNYKPGSPFDFPLGKILMKKTNSDVALLPGAGYGTALNTGNIRRMDLYALLPQDSRLVTLEKSAENQNPENVSKPVGGLIQTAGMEWKADLKKQPGQKVSNVKINGKNLEPEAWYTVATHTGMIEVLQGYKDLSQGRDVVKSEETITNLVEKYISEVKEISPPKPNISVIK